MKEDLTRWNRAGLSRVRYVEGNAATYLEQLRVSLRARVQGEASAWLDATGPETDDEDRAAYRRRILDQYLGARRDPAWEILRAFARSVHVLAGYIDAYANEAWLPTASRRESLRRLVGLLGYRPAPPASAETAIALLLKEGARGRIARGFAVRSRSSGESPSVVFETLEDLDGDAALNRLRPRNASFDPAPLPFGDGGWKFPVDEMPEGLAVGEKGVLEQDGVGWPVEVARVFGGDDGSAGGELLLKSLNGDPLPRFVRGAVRLHLRPTMSLSPLPSGSDTVELENEIALSEGECVVLEERGTAHFLKVRQSAGKRVRFDREVRLSRGSRLCRLQFSRKQRLRGVGRAYLIPKDSRPGRPVLFDSKGGRIRPALETVRIGGASAYFLVRGEFGKQVFYFHPEDKHLGRVRGRVTPKLVFSGKPPRRLVAGQCVLTATSDGDWGVGFVERVEAVSEGFSMKLDTSVPVRDVARLEGVFDIVLRPAGHDRNSLPAWKPRLSGAHATVVELDASAESERIETGRAFICQAGEEAFFVRATRVERVGSAIRLHLSPPFHEAADPRLFTRGDCVLHGNVVRAGHGESLPEKILGSGNSAEPGQCFDLPVEEPSRVFDEDFSSGVRLDVEVRVDGEVWKQVEHLRDSAPDDRHFMVEEDERGLRLCFGTSGGRRLPTGVNNVRVRARKGCGPAGNLPAGALVSMAGAHPLVEGFVAPLPASGGAEAESADSIRSNAPATVLALERAVSIDDFMRLALRHASVLQAVALPESSGRPESRRIRVVIVPVDGRPFPPGSPVAQAVGRHLRSRAVPGVSIDVRSFRSVSLRLHFRIHTDLSEEEAGRLPLRIRSRLEQALGVKARKLGQSLLRSEVVAMVAAEAGVVSADCLRFDIGTGEPGRRWRAGDGSVRRITVPPDALLFLSAEPSACRFEVRRIDPERTT